MKINFSILPLALALVVTGPALRAQTEPGVTPETIARPPALSEHIHDEVARLIRQNNPRLPAPNKPEVKAPPRESDDDILVLAPLTVTAKKPPELSPPKETPAEVFFRTGTIAEHVGKKVTTRFWFASAKGLMLSFDF